MQGYEASKVDSLKARKYIHLGALRAQIPTRSAARRGRERLVFYCFSLISRPRVIKKKRRRYFIAEQPAPAPHLARLEGRAAHTHIC